MKCPACDRELTSVPAGNITVDACLGGCGGIWFDNFELKKVDEPHQSVAELLVNIPRDPTVAIDFDRRRYCPKCRDFAMRRYFYTRRREVQVDECPNCAGHWLDAGELARIRQEVQMEREKKTAHEQFSAGVPVNKPAP